MTPTSTRPALDTATLDDWIAGEAISFALDSPASVDAALDRVVAALGDGVELLGFGEALHGGRDLLRLRNWIFQHLVEAHGYRAISIESSFPRSRLVNEHVAGRGPATYDDLRDAAIKPGFGGLEANRELVEWMRRYNADPAHQTKLRFYGFDSPTEATYTESPRPLLETALDFLASVDQARGRSFRERIDRLLGQDAGWENPEAIMNPAKAVGRSPAASELRLETEELITELRVRGPELVAKGGDERFREAVLHAVLARQLLTYHANLAIASSDRQAKALGQRDVMMADILEYIVARERGRGKVLAFAHNAHLQRGPARWQLGPDSITWWPAGAHLQAKLGRRYAVIGTAVGVSEANGIGRPEAGSLEARLIILPGPARFLPTHRGEGMPAAASATVRSGSSWNFSYGPLSPQSLTDFDWLAVLDTEAYAEGAPAWTQKPAEGDPPQPE